MSKITIEQKVNFIYGFIWTILMGIVIVAIAGSIFYFCIYTEKVTTVSKIVLDYNHTSQGYSKHDKILCEDGVRIYEYSKVVEYYIFLDCYRDYLNEYSFEDHGQIASNNLDKCLAQSNKICLVTHTERKVRNE